MLAQRTRASASRRYQSVLNRLTLLFAQWSGKDRRLSLRAPNAFANATGNMQVQLTFTSGRQTSRNVSVTLDNTAQFNLGLPSREQVTEVALQLEVQHLRSIGTTKLVGTFKNSQLNRRTNNAAPVAPVSPVQEGVVGGAFFYLLGQTYASDAVAACGWTIDQKEASAKHWTYQDGTLIMSQRRFYHVQCLVQFVHSSDEQEDEIDLQVVLKRGDRVVSQADACMLVDRNAITRGQLLLQYSATLGPTSDDAISLEVQNASGQPVRILGKPYSSVSVH